jgi:polyisoprenoid-binding protein YceI
MLKPFNRLFDCLLNRSTAFAFVAVALTISISADHSTAQDAADEAVTVPVPVESVVMLSPKNSSISFVGIHVGDDPKPRLGGFSKFSGNAKVDLANQKIKSLKVYMQVDSVWTEFEKLTAHLKNEDFFEVDKFPKASFVSKKIEISEAGKCTITGNLTLHGQTNRTSFPAEYRFENGGLVLSAKFQIDRSEFGMDQMLSGVDKLVAVELQIGKKTVIPDAKDGHGGDSKKKQSENKKPDATQKVSLKLPNMT